jgi:hypothetical protein
MEMRNIIKCVFVLFAVCTSYESDATDAYVYHGAWSKHTKTSSYVTSETYTVVRECPKPVVGIPTRPCTPTTKTYTDYVEKGFNEDHNLIGIQYGSYMVGWFKNSFGDDSAIVARDFDLTSFGGIDLGITAGATYGYTDCKVEQYYDSKASKKVCPHAALNFIYTDYKIQPVISVDLTGSVVSLELRYKL